MFSASSLCRFWSTPSKARSRAPSSPSSANVKRVHARLQTIRSAFTRVYKQTCHCALAQAAERRLSQPCRLGTLLKVRFVLELPQQPPQDDPAESRAELPPDVPSEPILTLPPALTAYVLLIALIHLRVLLPVEWEEWTVDVFGFIPKRYDTTLLDVTFPGGAGARVWSFVTYS